MRMFSNQFKTITLRKGFLINQTFKSLNVIYVIACMLINLSYYWYLMLNAIWAFDSERGT